MAHPTCRWCVVIVYHGTPITPQDVCVSVLTGRHALCSFAHPGQVDIVASVTASFALDNGAFSAWRAGKPVTDWTDYYAWCERWLAHPSCDWAIIPDVINGDEAANRALVDEWPHGDRGVPVWHLNETLGQLAWMAERFSRVAFGSTTVARNHGLDTVWRGSYLEHATRRTRAEAIAESMERPLLPEADTSFELSLFGDAP